MSKSRTISEKVEKFLNEDEHLMEIISWKASEVHCEWTDEDEEPWCGLLTLQENQVFHKKSVPGLNQGKCRRKFLHHTLSLTTFQLLTETVRSTTTAYVNRRNSHMEDELLVKFKTSTKLRSSLRWTSYWEICGPETELNTASGADAELRYQTQGNVPLLTPFC